MTNHSFTKTILMDATFLKTQACTTLMTTFHKFNEENIKKTTILLETFSVDILKSEYIELKELQKQQLEIYIRFAFQNKEKESKEYLDQVLSKTGILIQSYEKAAAVIGAVIKINKFNEKHLIK